MNESTILRKHKLSLIPLEQKGPQDFLLVVEPEGNAPLSVIGKGKGTVTFPMEKFGNAKEKTKTDSCGEPFQSYRYRTKQAVESPFALVGNRPTSLMIHWIPFQSETKKFKECKSPKKNFELSSFEVRTDPSSSGETYFFAEWNSPEKRQFLDLEKKLGDKVYDQHAPDCGQKNYSIQWVGKWSEKGCQALLKASVDCDGMGYKKGSFGKPLGKIVIQEKGQKEEWIIFEASGYEGDAFLGILTGSKKQKVDFYVYSGC